MAFKKLSNSFRYVKYSECEQGQVLAEGTYVGHRQGQFGIQHQVKEKTGEIAVLNSSGQLNWQLENLVTVGDYIRVTYDGMIKITKGKMKGKDSHQFILEVDEEKRNAGAKPLSSRSSEEDLDEDETTEEEDEVEEVAYKRSNVTAAKVKQVQEEDDEDEAPVQKRAANDDVLSKYRRRG